MRKDWLQGEVVESSSDRFDLFSTAALRRRAGAEFQSLAISVNINDLRREHTSSSKQSHMVEPFFLLALFVQEIRSCAEENGE